MRPRAFRKLVGLAIVLSSLLVSRAANADPIVVATVTSLGTTFHYDYSITNDPPGEDIVLVDINVLPFDLTLTNLFAPSGFQAIYDSGIGKVSFLPGLGSADLFALGTTLSGFGFDSAKGTSAEHIRRSRAVWHSVYRPDAGSARFSG